MSGLGSCVAPKPGLARHPAKGMFLAGVLFAFWFEGALDQGVVGVTWLLYRQAKKAIVKATLILLVLGYWPSKMVYSQGCSTD